MKLIIEIDEHVIDGLKTLGFDENQARNLIRDALGEFIASRQPTVDYMDRRYLNYSASFRYRKQAEILNRITWATFVKNGNIKLEG